MQKFTQLLSRAKQSLFALALTVFSGAAHSQTYTVSYTGGAQTLTIPATGNYKIECWGADGGGISTFAGGGVGGYSTGEYYISSPGTQLTIYVGGKGNPGSGNSSSAGAGGWNGGGGGSAVGYSGAGGGGATDIRVAGGGNRIIVAGGGGGAAYYGSSLISSSVAIGGNGGALLAQPGNSISSGGVITIGGGGQGANSGTPGMASVATSSGTVTGGGGGGISAGSSVGQPGIGGGPGGAAGPSSSGSTGSAGGGGGGFAGGAGGVQSSNGGLAGGGGSGYVGGVTNGTTVAMGHPSFVTNPDPVGNGKVIITRLCNISISAAQNPICVGNTILLSTDALSGITWFSGSNAQFVTVSPSVTTTYSLTGTSTIMVGTGTANCNTSSFITVSVNPLPALSIVAFPTLACSGGTSYLTGFGAASPTSYSWSNGMNSVQVATVNPVGNTTYTLTGVNNFGCTNTQTIQLLVSTNTLTVSQSTTAICSGQSATLSASGAVSYTWSNGLMFQSIPVMPTLTTLYMVMATDQNNCNISNSITLTVFNNPVVSISPDRTNVCKGESITLTGMGASNYLWLTSENTPTVAYTLPSDITYYYSVTGTDGNGCSGTANFSVTVSKCVGINEGNLSETVRVYPNPSGGQFNIAVSQLKDHLNLKVYNALGMLVKSQPILFTESELDLVNESNGIYFVSICDQDNVIEMVKVIKH